ncbi:hypothetical protein ACFWNN_45370 [Lentzea sp. NPDC058450]|uniref:hypothetical protein n=1 Tax=Lentzea sp. NPDC058450 TaxID=3346505 RepID=UPI003649D2D3
MHTRLQLDVTATFKVRVTDAGRVEVVIFDGSGGDASAVLDMFPAQADSLRAQLPVPARVRD